MSLSRRKCFSHFGAKTGTGSSTGQRAAVHNTKIKQMLSVLYLPLLFMERRSSSSSSSSWSISNRGTWDRKWQLTNSPELKREAESTAVSTRDDAAAPAIRDEQTRFTYGTAAVRSCQIGSRDGFQCVSGFPSCWSTNTLNVLSHHSIKHSLLFYLYTSRKHTQHEINWQLRWG